MRVCDIEDCGRKHHSHGYCDKHARRLRRHGDAETYLYNHRTYVNQHRYMKVQFGSAKMHDCSNCGSDAYDYALVKEWIPEGQLMIGRNGHGIYQMYSMDPGHYITLCRRCHSLFDNELLDELEKLSI